MMFDREDLVAQYAVQDRAAPYLRANFIASLDGAATVAGLSGGLNDVWDKQVFDTLRMLSDVVIVGAGTIRAEGYGALLLDGDAAAWRRAHALPDHPVLAIASANLRLDPASPVFTQAPRRPIVLTSAASPARERQALAEVAEIVVCGDARVEGRGMREALTERGLPQMLCEGGPHLFGSLLDADAVDELCLTVSPALVGGAAPRIAAGAAEGLRRMVRVHALPGGQMLFLRYRREPLSRDVIADTAPIR